MNNLFITIAILLTCYILNAQTWYALESGVTGWTNAPPGFPDNNYVENLHSTQDMLYVCGRISYVDSNIRASGFAGWDDSKWIAFDTTIEGLIKAISIFDNEIIIGSSQTGGLSPGNRLQRWDGNQWHNFGLGLDTNSSITVLKADDYRLYIGGYFDSIDGNAAKSVAFWDGMAWNNMNGGIENTDTSSNSYRTIHCMYIDKDGDVYAGGEFSHAGNVAAQSIAKWDGSNWHSLSNTDFKSITSIEKYNDDIYVAGIINTTRKIAKSIGNQWTIISSPHPSLFSPHYLKAFNGSLYAAENYNSSSTKVLRWDGDEWSTVGAFKLNSNSNGQIHALEVFQDELYVGGHFDSVNGMAAKNIAKWTMPPISIEEQELQNLQLTLSPNPAHSNKQLTLKRSKANEAGILNLYDLNGKLLQSIRLPVGEKHSIFNLKATSGVYLYQYHSTENPKINKSGKLVLLD